MMLALIVVAAAVGLSYAGFRATRAAYASAPYQVVRTEGLFELRDYPALTLVETAMSSGGNRADGSFSRLFGYITGRNEQQQKISMTTPVFISGAETNQKMAFVLPAEFSAGQAPRPAGGAVVVRQVPAGRFAVLRFRGARGARQEAEALRRLTAWMTAQRLAVLSPPVYGYFDPPWTPGWFRRNEVMLRVQPDTEGSPMP